MCPDGVRYVSIARNIVANQKYENFLGDPVPQFPPLFPLILSIIGFLGVDPFISVRFLNAIVFGLIIFFSRRLFSEVLTSRFLVITGQIILLFSIPLLYISKWAWTEPLFILLLMIFTIFYFKLIHATEENRLKIIAILSIISVLCNLQRYIGLFVIIPFYFHFLFLEKELAFSRKIKILVFFSVISLVPFSIWILRNYFLTGTLLGSRSHPRDFSKNVLDFTYTISTWFISPDIITNFELFSSNFIILVFLFIIFALIGIFFLYLIILEFKRNKENKKYLMKLYHIGIMMISYTLLLFFMSLQVRFDPMDSRILSPIFVYLIAAILIILNRLSISFIIFLNLIAKRIDSIPSDIKNSKFAVFFEKGLVLIILISLLIHPICYNFESLNREMEDGAGGFNHSYWKESSIMKYIQDKNWDGEIYSNNPHIIYGNIALITKPLPYKGDDFSEFKNEINNVTKAYIIWLGESESSSVYYDLTYIRQNLNVKLIQKFPKGTVYEII